MENYEKFKKDVLSLTKIDLNCYKEKQMKRRIDTLISKTSAKSYDEYVVLLKKDKNVFEAFVTCITLAASSGKEVCPSRTVAKDRSAAFWTAAADVSP